MKPSPAVGFNPALRLFPEGHTTEPSVSVATVAAQIFAAAATADPVSSFVILGWLFTSSIVDARFAVLHTAADRL